MTEAPHLPHGAVPDPPVPPGVDPSKPSPARLYDYYLGGHNNFEVDRKAAEALRQSLPALSDAAWANRGFHQRAATWLAAEVGLRQFIDIGSGPGRCWPARGTSRSSPPTCGIRTPCSATRRSAR